MIQAAFVYPVFAREADPSKLPNNQPLLPPAIDVAPNYKNNVNYSAQPAEDNQSTSSTNSLDAKPAAPNNSFQADGGGLFASAPVKKLSILFILAAVILGYVFRRKAINGKE